MKELEEQKIELPESIDVLTFYGNQDIYLKMIEEAVDVRLVARGHIIKMIGSDDQVKIAGQAINDLIASCEKKNKLSRGDVETAIQIAKLGLPGSSEVKKAASLNGDIVLATNESSIQPKSDGQKELIESLNGNDIIFAIGPAGTGKTYLAVAMAVAFLKAKRVKKIILARPAVEAGESLGFLPGDFKEKIEPYLKPLYDALEDMLPKELLKKYLDQQTIEILPLAYMRGRTLNNAFVILDEAQNSTFTQMKMFLTRLGFNAKAVVTGDITQIDLPTKKDSGLVSSIHVLSGIKGIAFVQMSKNDVVRHYLVKEIIDAYDKYNTNEKPE